MLYLFLSFRALGGAKRDLYVKRYRVASDC